MIKYISLFILLSACSTEKKTLIKAYPNAIGDIEYNPNIDGDFERCGTFSKSGHNSFSNSYYGTGGLKYKGEMLAIKEHIHAHYKSPKIKNQTGFLTVRFLVNCKGESGMFRIHSYDTDLQAINFDNNISNQLLQAIRNLKDWNILRLRDGNNYDYHQYITIKIVDSEIKEITP